MTAQSRDAEIFFAWIWMEPAGQLCCGRPLDLLNSERPCLTWQTTAGFRHVCQSVWKSLFMYLVPFWSTRWTIEKKTIWKNDLFALSEIMFVTTYIICYVLTWQETAEVDPLEPNRVWFFSRATGTHTGPLGPIQATGNGESTCLENTVAQCYLCFFRCFRLFRIVALFFSPKFVYWLHFVILVAILWVVDCTALQTKNCFVGWLHRLFGSWVVERTKTCQHCMKFWTCDVWVRRPCRSGRNCWRALVSNVWHAFEAVCSMPSIPGMSNSERILCFVFPAFRPQDFAAASSPEHAFQREPCQVKAKTFWAKLFNVEVLSFCAIFGCWRLTMLMLDSFSLMLWSCFGCCVVCR